MEAVNLSIKKEMCYERAQKLFFEISGLHKNGAKFDRMRAAAARMRELAEDRINIRSKCNYYEDLVLNGSTAVIGGQSFECRAFEQIGAGQVKGAYLYALTAGDFDFKNENITNRLYLDIWGTAFTDAARELLEKELNDRDMISDEFGPGFYGMPVREMIKIDRLLKFEDIGVRFVDNKILSPVKSCCGIYFRVTGDYKKLDSECLECQSSAKSCVLCKKNRSRTWGADCIDHIDSKSMQPGGTPGLLAK